MVDERAALPVTGLPAVAAEAKGMAGSTSSPAPPPATIAPPPASSPRPPPILTSPLTALNGRSAAEPGLNGNGNGGSGGIGRARTGDEGAPLPSPRTQRFTPVRALHVGTPPVPEGVAVTDASTSFTNSPLIGSSERLQHHEGAASASPTFAPPSPGRLGQPQSHVAARRMSNVDRRVRSEAFPVQKRHMSIASSRRPSILTGGYESSTDDDSKDDATATEVPPKQLRGTALLNHHSPSHLAAPGGRRRAQSLLVTPPAHDSWSPNPSASPATSRRPSRLSRSTVSGSPLRTPVGGRTPTDIMSRAPSEALSLSQLPSRTGRSGSGGGRTREPSGSAADYEREDQRRMEQRRGNPLATSLGLGPSRPVILSPDQIENLLGDADFNSAKARMAKPMRRQSSITSNDPPQQQQFTPPTTSTSTFPPHPSITVITPPPLSRPYLVTAPPALTNGDWAGRDRATSVSSSVGASTVAGTPHRNVTPLNTRRRALSTATLDSDGGHIPFTHHVPAVLLEDDDDDIEDHESPLEDLATQTAAPQADVDSTTTATQNNSGDTTPMAHNQLDDRTQDPKARRRISGLFGLRGRKRDMSPPPPATLTHVRSAPPLAKKRTEASDRTRDRDAEMRRAELARREEEQMEEQRYKALLLINAHPASQRRAQRAALHLDGYYSFIYQGLENPPKLNLLAVLRWKRKTEIQKQAREKWVKEHVDSTHLASPGLWSGGLSGSPSSPASDAIRALSPRLFGSPSPLPPRSVASATSKPEHRAGRDWQYTLDDIQGYTDTGGRVDFFIPPNVAPEPVERERAQSLSLQSEAQLSVPSEVAESATGAEKELSPSTARLVSPSTPSLTRAEVVDDGSTAGDLSRRPSLEPNPPPLRPFKSRHRSHQSTSGLALGPFRALGRNFANVMNPVPVLTDNEDERRGANLPWASNDSPNSPQHQVSAHSLRDTRGLLGLRRTHEQVVTSDDEPPHRRRLLRSGKGFDRGSRRVVTANDHTSRDDHLRSHEQERTTDQALTRNQAPVPTDTRADLELAASIMRQVEDEIFAAHQQSLLNAQRQLKQVEKSESDMRNAISHFVSQLDEVRGVFHTAADVDIKFEGLEALSRPELRASDDETADQLSPLAFESDVNFSDRNGRGGPRPRPIRRPPAATALQALPSFAFGLQAWPKRSTLDPTLGVTVNPFRRVELTCQKAEATVREMEEQRASTTRKIQEMVVTVNGFTQQTKAVLTWVKDANNKIHDAKQKRAALSQQVRGGLIETVLILPGFDTVSDFLVRVFLGVLSYLLRLHRLTTWARGRSYIAWALLFAFVAMLVFFYLAGSDDLPVPPSAQVPSPVTLLGDGVS
ncbi:hypothetical protein CC85DRAFT_326046 [Cutaneotrichosporon oleaginosum]|uniref:Uncharacterized protein n=1 Tax=Cutaneotrichosporon oleaginosum TaxID=879819 RepID=A0A0J0XVM8_9TREE|nr:uncharacterized protein CC85DRAFT_326046 [Cutaneotrichosporon oleaginosum]KLT45135.1 hypothetical protein CC85DRAFT_326046 [Cutaneotrichosporon oleaginosum]TXT09815.1 hypothetical protein COLE_03749 [Cutaneotrichosporon oleaginosum]